MVAKVRILGNVVPGWYTRPTHMTTELTQNAPALLALIDNAMDAIVSVDEQFNVILFNRAAETMFGYTAEEMLGQSLNRLIPLRFRAHHAQQINTFGRTGETRRIMGKLGVITGLYADGTEIPLEAAISRHNDGARKIYSVILRNTSEWLRIEKALQAQKDLYAMLSLTSHAISQGKDKESLFEDICRIAVECGHFRFAWVGWLNADEDSFAPVKIHGDDSGTVMEQFRFPREQRNQFHALRMELLEKDGQIIMNNLADKTTGTAWQALAEKAGVQSAAFFPIREEGKIQGIIAMYSAEADYFTEMLIPTLQTIAGDLSVGLDNLAKANRLLRTIQANQLLAEIVRGMDEACFALDKDWRFTFVNDRGLTLLRHSREEMIGNSIWDVF